MTTAYLQLGIRFTVFLKNSNFLHNFLLNIYGGFFCSFYFYFIFIILKSLILTCIVFNCINLFRAVRGPHCCLGFSPVVASGSYSPVVAHGLLIAAAFLVLERRLWECRPQQSWPLAQLLCGIWDLLGPGVVVMSSALAG